MFKLYFLDTGLLAEMSGLHQKILIENQGIFTEFKGSLAENFIAQELTALDLVPYYWTSEGKAEVDFVVENQSEIIACEVKSGINLRSKSLQVFKDKFKNVKIFKFSLQKYDNKADITNVSLYQVSTIANKD